MSTGVTCCARGACLSHSNRSVLRKNMCFLTLWTRILHVRIFGRGFEPRNDNSFFHRFFFFTSTLLPQSMNFSVLDNSLAVDRQCQNNNNIADTENRHFCRRNGGATLLLGPVSRAFWKCQLLLRGKSLAFPGIPGG